LNINHSQIEQSVAVKLQLLRPSDGAVSDPRKFDFLPLDGGHNFWAAKRMKTNFNVFSNILAMGTKSATPIVLSMESGMDIPDEPAKRKVPTSSGLLLSPVHLRGAAASPRVPAPCATIVHPPIQNRPQVLPIHIVKEEEQEFTLPPRATIVNLRPISGLVMC